MSRNGKPRSYSPKEAEAYKEKVRLYARAAGARVIPRKVEIVVQLHIWQKSLWRGDVDNYEKCVFDALKGVAWEDDRYITCCLTRKRKLDEHGERIRVQISELP